MAAEITIGLLAGVIIVIGGVGSVLPILPGPPLSFAGLWLYAWHTGYDKVTPTALVVFGILTALTLVTDVMAPALGARGYKSTAWGTWGAVIGAFAGIMAMGPIGILLGPLLGAFLGEILRTKNMEHSLRIAWGSFIGFVIGSLFKLGIIAGMLAWLAYAAFWK